MTFVISNDLLTSTAKKVTITHGFEGSGGESLGAEFPCRFREILTTDKSLGDATEKTAEAMLWCDSGIDLSEDDVVEVDGNKRYRVIRYVAARSTGSAIRFRKLELERYKG